MKRGMYLAAALCLLLCGCGKKDAAEAQAVQQRYAALTGAVAEAEIVSHPEGETRSFTVRCTCDRTKDTATTTVMAPEELAGLSATVTGEKLLIQYDGPALAAGVGDTVSPANCIPYLLRALAEGYVLEVGEETLEDTPCRQLTLDTTDADGEKVVCTVWLAEEDPVYAELSREGKLLLSVRFTAFQQTESDGGE